MVKETASVLATPSKSEALLQSPVISEVESEDLEQPVNTKDEDTVAMARIMNLKNSFVMCEIVDE